MSANLVVDIAPTCEYRQSVAVFSGSDLLVGQIVDLLHSDTFTNVYVAGVLGSGPIQVRIQTADTTTSGDFTDPTSGLARFPDGVSSGGIVWANSGLWASGALGAQPVISGSPLFSSGGIQFAAFQRPHRFGRLVYHSGAFPNPIAAGFVANKRTVGSGGGFTFSPTSGAVSV